MPQQNNNCQLPAGPEALFEFFEFRRDGKIVEGAPLCGLSLKAAGSMRFRWNEQNPNREKLNRWLSLSKPPQTSIILDSDLFHSSGSACCRRLSR